METMTAATVTALFACRNPVTLPDGTASGIVKTAESGPVAVGPTGLKCDTQVDRSVHGGVDKALHAFPVSHYPHLAAAFPAAAATLVAGSLGENLALAGVDETAVCIGDVVALGELKLQLTQPRRPCWKIDQRFDVHGMAAWVRRTGRVGWYYRVLQPGLLRAGDCMTLLTRDPAAPTVADYHALLLQTRPPAGKLARLQQLKSLPAECRKRISQRLDWLRQH